MGNGRALARAYRRFAEADHPDASPLYKRVARALSESDEALRAIEAVPARKRNPAVILAALHDLALAGRALDAAREEHGRRSASFCRLLAERCGS